MRTDDNWIRAAPGTVDQNLASSTLQRASDWINSGFDLNLIKTRQGEPHMQIKKLLLTGEVCSLKKLKYQDMIKYIHTYLRLD